LNRLISLKKFLVEDVSDDWQNKFLKMKRHCFDLSNGAMIENHGKPKHGSIVAFMDEKNQEAKICVFIGSNMGHAHLFHIEDNNGDVHVKQIVQKIENIHTLSGGQIDLCMDAQKQIDPNILEQMSVQLINKKEEIQFIEELVYKINKNGSKCIFSKDDCVYIGCTSFDAPIPIVMASFNSQNHVRIMSKVPGEIALEGVQRFGESIQAIFVNGEHVEKLQKYVVQNIGNNLLVVDAIALKVLQFFDLFSNCT